jgi:2-oxo-4-hydroxy-4-carboxy-5-ureidoimidazoline decarboxylase
VGGAARGPGAALRSVDELHRALCAAVAAAGPEEQLALIRAHPDLAGRAARAGELTAASSAEQAGAGLGSLSDEEYSRFHKLNDRYRTRFDFPFILAVTGHSKASILAAFEARLPNTPTRSAQRRSRKSTGSRAFVWRR